MTDAAPFALLDRPAGSILFHTPDRRIDAAAFLAEATRLAAALPHREHVVNLCQDRYAFALGLAACLLRGHISLLSGDPSTGLLARLSQDFPAAYVLTDTADAPKLPWRRHVVTVAPEPGPSAGFAVPLLDAAQPAAIVLTSGSTGAPVGTIKTWGELVARSRAAGLRFGLQEGAPATVVGTPPPGHMFGLETTVLLPWHAAVAVWCGPAFFPADVMHALQRLAGPRILVTTPLHLRALLRTAPPARPPERVISATAPLDRSLAAAAEQAWGTTVLEIFGATELGSIASRRTVEGDDWSLYPGLSLSAETPAAPPLIGAPYAAPRPVSDVVEPSPDGRSFRLIGRTGDLVKLGGRRASLAGLSRILNGIEGVRDGAFLAPDDLDRTPTARLVAVAVAPSHSVASLTEALRLQIDPVFLPRPLLLLDELPRNAVGKLPRAALVAALTAGGR